MRDNKILWSFGSGDWADGVEAQEVMAQVDGRWVGMQLTSMKTRVVIDKKSVVHPFDKLDIVKNSTVVTLEDVMDACVLIGEVGICMTHHALVRDNGTYSIKPTGELCFVLDRVKPPSDPEKKPTKKPAPKKKAIVVKKKAKGKPKAEKKADDPVKEEDEDSDGNPNEAWWLVDGDCGVSLMTVG